MMVSIIIDPIKPVGPQEVVKEQIACNEYTTTYQMLVKLRPDGRGPPKANKPNAEEECFSAVSLEQLRRLLKENTDVFRVEMGCDPPVKVELLKWYPSLHMEYLKEHVGEVERAGLVYRNYRSRWA
ncbi:hypothetical protein H310_13741 [Aphanomyces invadans]|uniref:Uncharacterized protein n=1 Tax=Aphanomyces invadans TaxID=157072 RepID=A0A024TC82_9STRA|nr:hypothetical protein H310_13741 [Aphanomyces invadans]ETV91663.1 hypothetical protein H310_13741 [Aphanomyces invadans]|eukprot:XP_008879589.1 hypothetical protein H310_13741 [Aphanomyces invadans]